MSDTERLVDKLDQLGYDEGSEVSLAALRSLITLEAQSDKLEVRHVAAQLVARFLAGDLDGPPEGVQWKPYELGVTKAGDVVRVKPDAYEDELGEKHNRLSGVVAAVRGGRVLVKYFGRDDGMGVPHNPDLIEVMA